MPLGENLGHRTLLYWLPSRKLSAQNVMYLMASHYEDTIMDPSVVDGVGSLESPHAPALRGSTAGTSTTTQHCYPKTYWSFIAQVRPRMPPLRWRLCRGTPWTIPPQPRACPYDPVRRSPCHLQDRVRRTARRDPCSSSPSTKLLGPKYVVQLCYGRYKETYLVW
jgi:dipeptidase